MFQQASEFLCGDNYNLPSVVRSTDPNAPLVNVVITERREKIVVSRAFDSLPAARQAAYAVHAIILTEIERQHVTGSSARFMKYKTLATLLNVECEYSQSRGWFVKDDCAVVQRIAKM